MPGECRACWKPCFNKVEPGNGSHCDECLRLLATHGYVAVRAALAKEDDVPTGILELLASDLEVAVSAVAADKLKHSSSSGENNEPNDDIWGI